MTWIQKIFSKSMKAFSQPIVKEPFQIKEDDVFLVSYPKSGNTWVRHLIGNYLHHGKMDFTNGHLFMPDIHYNPKQIELIETHPRFIKSHFPFCKEYKNVIYLVREGRDTAVSLYYFLRKMKQIPLDMEFSDYLENYFFAGKSPYGQWNTHIFSWLRDNKIQNILLVRYEDLLENTEKELIRILEFSKIPIDKELVKVAVKHASFDSMQKDELKNSETLKKMGHDITYTNYGIVREGKSNTWRNQFTEDESRKFIKMYGDAMTFLKYSI